MKRILSLSLIFLFQIKINSISAQGYIKPIPTSFVSFTPLIAETNNGAIHAVTTFNFSFTSSLISKIDENGTITNSLVIDSSLNGTHHYIIDKFTNSFEINFLAILSNAGDLSSIIYTFDDNGNYQSNRIIDQADSITYFSLSKNTLGEIYLGGEVFLSTGENTPIISKYSSVGSLLWQYDIDPGHVGTAKINKIEVLSNGDVIGVGYYDIFGTYDDSFIIKIDQNGNLIWSKWLNAPFYNYNMNSISIHPTTNHIYVTGQANEQDAIIVHCNENGDMINFLELGSNSSAPKVYFSSNNLIVPGSSFFVNDRYINVLTLRPDLGLLSFDILDTNLNFDFVTSSDFSNTGDYYFSVNSGNTNPIIIKADSLRHFKPNIIHGSLYEDRNIDCQFNLSDSALSNRILIIEDSLQFNTISTDQYGKYYYSTLTNEIQINNQNHIGLNSTCPPGSGFLADFSIQDSLYFDFGYSISSVTDFSSSLLPITLFRPGLNGRIRANVFNSGTTTGNITFKLNYNSDLDFINSTIPPTNQVGDTLIWTFNNLQPMDQILFFIEFNVPINLPVLTPLNFYGYTINPLDTNIVNDSSDLFLFVSSSFDPNDKTSQPDGDGVSHFINGDEWITYRIRFQNTGNDTAFTVFLLDTLSASLDLSTLQFLNASHNYSIDFLSNRVLKINFNNIQLPDSTTDELNSHGFIFYRIKPIQSLNPGEQIFNTAHIFFDFNIPVATNTHFLTKKIFSGISELDLGNLLIYPNPSNEVFSIESLTDLGEITVVSIDGNVMFKTSINTNSYQLNLNFLSNGMYILQVQNKLPQKIILNR